MVLNFFRTIHKMWPSDTRLVLMVVIQSTGDSPGRSGFLMAVRPNGEMFGTIGGGIMEQKLVDLCKRLLTGSNFKPFAKRQIHKANIGADRSGMICDGEQIIAFYDLYLSKNDIISQILSGDYSFILLNQEGLQCVNQEDFHHVIDTDLQFWSYVISIKSANKLIIFGAGHVSLALCQIISQLDFEIFLFDDRKALNTMEANEFAHYKEVIDYENASNYIPSDGNIYVVLVSFGFRSDEIILRSIYGKNYYYIGMMGSTNKIKAMRMKLLEEGFDGQWFDKICAPIGIDINSKTSYEIALSIAAQLVKCKNID